MVDAAGLSMAFVDAYNRRDTDAIRSMLAADVTYARPGPRPVVGVEAIMGQYREDWRTYDALIEVRRVIEAGDTVAIELTLRTADGKLKVEAIVVHRWADDRMTEYRLYLDPLPA